MPRLLVRKQPYLSVFVVQYLFIGEVKSANSRNVYLPADGSHSFMLRHKEKHIGGCFSYILWSTVLVMFVCWSRRFCLWHVLDTSKFHLIQNNLFIYLISCSHIIVKGKNGARLLKIVVHFFTLLTRFQPDD